MRILLNKELILNKYQLLIAMIIMLITGLISSEMTGIPMFLPMIYSCLLAMMTKYNDFSNPHSEALMNSLPVRREQIVLSKYLFSLICSLILFAIAFLINLVVPMFTSSSLWAVLLNFVIVTVYLSCYFPLSFIFGPRFLNLAIFSLGFSVPALIFPLINVGRNNNFWGLFEWLKAANHWLLIALLLVISTTLLTASFYFSRFIYQRKAF